MPNLTDSCATCFFFATQTLADAGGGGGLVTVCRRNAPDVPAAVAMSEAQWPQVQPKDWCGDFLTTYPTTIGQWTPYNTIASSGGGSIGTPINTQAEFSLVGKVTFIQASISTVSAGAATGALIITLPSIIPGVVGANVPTSIFPALDVTNTRALIGQGLAGSNQVSLTRDDGSSPFTGAASINYLISGYYKNAL